jgi:hypothetical protein
VSKKLLTPKYLTKEIAEKAIATAFHATMHDRSPLNSCLVQFNHCHVVILAPAMEDDHAISYPNWPDYPLCPVVLCEQSAGDKDDWKHEYDAVARSKALQLWTDRNADQAGVNPHLLFLGDTPYWGGVKRNGIVVACSGVQQWFDRLISSIVADTLVALAYDAFENDKEKQQGHDFLV